MKLKKENLLKVFLKATEIEIQEFSEKELKEFEILDNIKKYVYEQKYKNIF